MFLTIAPFGTTVLNIFFERFRLTWVIITSLSLTGMFVVLRGVYNTYTYNAISFVTETAYLDWNTTFPAVSVCEITSSEILLTKYYKTVVRDFVFI